MTKKIFLKNELYTGNFKYTSVKSVFVIDHYVDDKPEMIFKAENHHSTKIFPGMILMHSHSANVYG